LTISSPLEAHKPRAIIHSIVGVDVGFENPMFAALEVDYTESDQDPSGAAFESAEKVTGSQLLTFGRARTQTDSRRLVRQLLTYYELDLGLNHVVRKWSEATDPRANLLVQGNSSLLLVKRGMRKLTHRCSCSSWRAERGDGSLRRSLRRPRLL
jgi:splicing factor 3B subunit 3